MATKSNAVKVGPSMKDDDVQKIGNSVDNDRQGSNKFGALRKFVVTSKEDKRDG